MQKLTVREELDNLQQLFTEIQKEINFLRARIERLENEEKG
jgi:BMFP domain-containing protein YqiC